MTKTEETEETEIETTIHEMAAKTADNIYLIDSMSDALIDTRPDLQEIVVERVHIIKSGLVDQYFAAAFYEEPTPESEVAPDPESTEGR